MKARCRKITRTALGLLVCMMASLAPITCLAGQPGIDQAAWTGMPQLADNTPRYTGMPTSVPVKALVERVLAADNGVRPVGRFQYDIGTLGVGVSASFSLRF